MPSKTASKAKGASRAGKPGQASAKPRAAPRSAPKASAAGDWREATLQRMRGLILQAEPQMVEEQKWRKPSNGMVGVPVWSRHGIVCTGETYKAAVKLTFARGASLPDPARLFNASLDAGTRRAIDIREGETVDAAAFKRLVKAAVAENAATKGAKEA